MTRTLERIHKASKMHAKWGDISFISKTVQLSQ